MLHLARDLAGVAGVVAQAVAVGQQQHRQIAQHAQRQRPGGGQRVVLGHRQPEGLVGHRLDVQRSGVVGDGQQAQVGGAAGHRGQHRLGLQLLQLQAGLGPAPAGDGGERRQQVGGHGGDGGDPQAAPDRAPVQRGGHGQIVGVAQQAAAPLHDLGPGRGEGDLAAGPLEEPHPQAALELLDLAAEPGLGDADRLGGPAEVAVVGHRHRVFELAQRGPFHKLSLSVV